MLKTITPVLQNAASVRDLKTTLLKAYASAKQAPANGQLHATPEQTQLAPTLQLRSLQCDASIISNSTAHNTLGTHLS